jgi:hypothetical protein
MLESAWMRPHPVRTWREWFYESFLRGGYFSIRPLPSTEAERDLDGQQEQPPPKDAIRLDLNERD